MNNDELRNYINRSRNYENNIRLVAFTRIFRERKFTPLDPGDLIHGISDKTVKGEYYTPEFESQLMELIKHTFN